MYLSSYQRYCVCEVTSPTGQRRMITLNGTTCAPRNECLKDNGGCAHLCEDQPVGFQCSCFPTPDGFQLEVWTLSDNGYDCNDVNECADPTFLDEHCPSPAKCINTPGFYSCFSVAAIGKSGALSRSKGKYIYSNEVHSNLCLAALQIMIIAVKLRMMWKRCHSSWHINRDPTNCTRSQVLMLIIIVFECFKWRLN